MSATEHIVYGLLWLSFGAVHSLLAGESVKRRLRPLLGDGYRFAYNGFATLHVALIWVGGQALLGANAVDLGLPDGARALLAGLRWSGAAIILVALLHYDLGRFSGLTQLLGATRGRSIQQSEVLHVTGLHRYLRHPLYAGAYLYLWGSVTNEFQLATAVWASAYLAIGTHLEETRLVALYGEPYERYRARVPSLIPWKGRAG